MNVSVILPSYDPSPKLIEAVEALIGSGFDDIIVINDGSSKDSSKQIFEQIKKYPHVTLISHEKNMGKGRALKTGFEFFLENRKDKAGVVTTDDDLQHTPADICACAEDMENKSIAVFGARSFKGDNIPPKSRIGNNITSFTFRFLCGIKITDTQTGLRAIPRSYLPTLIKTGGERFEYETNMLLAMKENGMEFCERSIETIYSDNNSGTHFNPFKDSVKIYAVIIKYIISSMTASLIDLLCFTLLNLLLPREYDVWLRILLSTGIARIISSAVNYIINKNKVFKSKGNVKGSLLKYYCLCIAQAGSSYGLVYLLTFLTGAEQSLLQTVYKMLIDIVLFFLCFTIQREWVFKEKRK
ncbi:MAG TPA: polysaccharide biosynthesis protein GtrA [Ruminococcaceae bacterium]|nr:polysaccharide biosynthesis protein GtrA [Oscillospiraceae bacterium]